MDTKKDFKDTLLMPRTEFPMRGNLGQNEPQIQKKWEESGLYEQVLAKNADRPLYILHDGPPYANGSIHAGTAFNKVLKDFVIRYKNMSGFKAPYLPGWDTHGLPIENALSKDRKVDRKQFDVVKFREMCAEYALEQIDTQRQQFRRLGVLGEWDNPYITMTKNYEASQLRLFAEMVEKGLIYKGLKPVYWSPSSESALAEAEIEYKDVTSPSIYVAMKVKDHKGLLPKNSEFLIWTTTPWTIPANLAICLGPEIEYEAVKVDDSRVFVVSKNLKEKLVEILGFEKTETLGTYFGSELEGITYKHPFYERISPVILG
ncbi:MAG: class I tRNA ligase family protein, partial [Candidatus Izemoplasmatales bacterium]